MTPQENGRTHEPSLRELAAEFDGFRDLMDEREKWRTTMDVANKEALRVALNSVEKMADVTATALKEYKTEANEWRGTVRDLIAGLREAQSERTGGSKAVIAGIALASGVGGMMVPVIIYVVTHFRGALP